MEKNYKQEVFINTHLFGFQTLIIIMLSPNVKSFYLKYKNL